MLLECKVCGCLIFEFDYLPFGCPICESRFIGKYHGIIGMYVKTQPEEVQDR